MCPPSKPWGFVRGTYTRPGHNRGYTLNEPGLVAKGEMLLAIEHQPNTFLWEHYELGRNGHWWPMSGHDMGALLCDPEFVACVTTMDLSTTGSTKSAWDSKPKPVPLPPATPVQDEVFSFREELPPVPQDNYSYLYRPRRGGKQRKGRAWWNR